MGCLHTKTKVEPLPETITRLPTPEAPPETDPRLPLNARQVFKLKKNWKGIKRKLEVTGVEVFARLVILHHIVSFGWVRLYDLNHDKYSNGGHIKLISESWVMMYCWKEKKNVKQARKWNNEIVKRQKALNEYHIANLSNLLSREISALRSLIMSISSYCWWNHHVFLHTKSCFLPFEKKYINWIFRGVTPENLY